MATMAAEITENVVYDVVRKIDANGREILNSLQFSEGLVRREIDLVRLQLEILVKKLQTHVTSQLKELVERERLDVEKRVQEARHVVHRFRQTDIKDQYVLDETKMELDYIQEGMRRRRLQFIISEDMKSAMDSITSFGKCVLVTVHDEMANEVSKEQQLKDTIADTYLDKNSDKKSSQEDKKRISGDSQEKSKKRLDDFKKPKVNGSISKFVSNTNGPEAELKKCSVSKERQEECKNQSWEDPNIDQANVIGSLIKPVTFNNDGAVPVQRVDDKRNSANFVNTNNNVANDIHPKAQPGQFEKRMDSPTSSDKLREKNGHTDNVQKDTFGFAQVDQVDPYSVSMLLSNKPSHKKSLDVHLSRLAKLNAKINQMKSNSSSPKDSANNKVVKENEKACVNEARETDPSHHQYFKGNSDSFQEDFEAAKSIAGGAIKEFARSTQEKSNANGSETSNNSIVEIDRNETVCDSAGKHHDLEQDLLNKDSAISDICEDTGKRNHTSCVIHKCSQELFKNGNDESNSVDKEHIDRDKTGLSQIVQNGLDQDEESLEEESVIGTRQERVARANALWFGREMPSLDIRGRRRRTRSASPGTARRENESTSGRDFGCVIDSITDKNDSVKCSVDSSHKCTDTSNNERGNKISKIGDMVISEDNGDVRNTEDRVDSVDYSKRSTYPCSHQKQAHVGHNGNPSSYTNDISNMSEINKGSELLKTNNTPVCTTGRGRSLASKRFRNRSLTGYLPLNLRNLRKENAVESNISQEQEDASSFMVSNQHSVDENGNKSPGISQVSHGEGLQMVTSSPDIANLPVERLPKRDKTRTVNTSGYSGLTPDNEKGGNVTVNRPAVDACLGDIRNISIATVPTTTLDGRLALSGSTTGYGLVNQASNRSRYFSTRRRLHSSDDM